MTLTHQLGLATLVVGITVVMHLAGFALLLAILRRYRRASRRYLVILLNGGAILVAAFGLFALHSAEIWIWAGLYQLLGAFTDFEHALYFSTSTYVTIGYGDIVLPPGATHPRRDRGRERDYPDRLVNGLLFLDRRSHETPRTQFRNRSRPMTGLRPGRSMAAPAAFMKQKTALVL